MFEMIQNKPGDAVLTAVYYTVRLIRHRHLFSDDSREFDLIVQGIVSEPSSQDKLIAQQLIQDIEQSEKLPLTKLNDLKAEAYIQQLINILQDQIRREFDYEQVDGNTLLKQLRQMYRREFAASTESDIPSILDAAT
jgi:hypothetical protein